MISKPSLKEWQHIKQKYKPGDYIVVTVLNVQPYGFWGESKEGFLCLTKIPDVTDDDPRDLVMPSVGAEVRGVVIAWHEYEHQLLLSTKDSSLKNPERWRVKANPRSL